MVRRQAPRKKLDERAFPIRVKVLQQAIGQDWLRQDRVRTWLRENIGPGEYADYCVVDNQPDVEAFYFRSLDAAQRFLAAFPDCELADTTHRLQHLQEAKRWAAAGLKPEMPHDFRRAEREAREARAAAEAGGDGAAD